jgi:hypothetical protein
VKRQRSKTISPDNAVAAFHVRGFLARHPGPLPKAAQASRKAGSRSTEDLREGKSKGGRRGWWEVRAADGYRLRCEWVRIANEEQLTFSEIAPESET